MSDETEEGGFAELLALLARPEVDTLLRVETEGGNRFLVDGGELRAVVEAARRHRQAVELAKDTDALAMVASGTHRDVFEALTEREQSHWRTVGGKVVDFVLPHEKPAAEGVLVEDPAYELARVKVQAEDLLSGLQSWRRRWSAQKKATAESEARVGALQAEVAGLKKKLEDMSGYAQTLKDERTQAVRRLAALSTKDVWKWQGDGSDNLDSMSNQMVVHITASELRGLLAGRTVPEAYHTAWTPFLAMAHKVKTMANVQQRDATHVAWALRDSSGEVALTVGDFHRLLEAEAARESATSQEKADAQAWRAAKARWTDAAVEAWLEEPKEPLNPPEDQLLRMFRNAVFGLDAPQSPRPTGGMRPEEGAPTTTPASPSNAAAVPLAPTLPPQVLWKDGRTVPTPPVRDILGGHEDCPDNPCPGTAPYCEGVGQDVPPFLETQEVMRVLVAERARRVRLAMEPPPLWRAEAQGYFAVESIANALGLPFPAAKDATPPGRCCDAARAVACTCLGHWLCDVHGERHTGETHTTAPGLAVVEALRQHVARFQPGGELHGLGSILRRAQDFREAQVGRGDVLVEELSRLRQSLLSHRDALVELLFNAKGTGPTPAAPRQDGVEGAATSTPTPVDELRDVRRALSHVFTRAELRASKAVGVTANELRDWAQRLRAALQSLNRMADPEYLAQAQGEAHGTRVPPEQDMELARARRAQADAEAQVQRMQHLLERLRTANAEAARRLTSESTGLKHQAQAAQVLFAFVVGLGTAEARQALAEYHQRLTDALQHLHEAHGTTAPTQPEVDASVKKVEDDYAQVLEALGTPPRGHGDGNALWRLKQTAVTAVVATEDAKWWRETAGRAARAATEATDAYMHTLSSLRALPEEALAAAVAWWTDVVCAGREGVTEDMRQDFADGLRALLRDLPAWEPLSLCLSTGPLAEVAQAAGLPDLPAGHPAHHAGMVLRPGAQKVLARRGRRARWETVWAAVKKASDESPRT